MAYSQVHTVISVMIPLMRLSVKFKDNILVGIRMLKGHPKSQGLTLQRERSRQSLLRLDPTAALQRWLKSTRLFFILFEVFHVHNRDFKQSTTATATKTWENKRVHE